MFPFSYVIDDNESGWSALEDDWMRIHLDIDDSVVLGFMPPRAGKDRVAEAIWRLNDQGWCPLAKTNAIDRHGQELFPGKAVSTRCSVVYSEKSQSTYVIHPDRLGSRFEQRSVALLRIQQRQFNLLALGNIPRQSTQANRATKSILDWRHHQIQPPILPGRVLRNELVVKLLRLFGTSEILKSAILGLDAECILKRGSNHLLRRKPKKMRTGGIETSLITKSGWFSLAISNASRPSSAVRTEYPAFRRRVFIR